MNSLHSKPPTLVSSILSTVKQGFHTGNLSFFANSLCSKRAALFSGLLFKIYQGFMHGISVCSRILSNTSGTYFHQGYFSRVSKICTHRISDSWPILCVPWIKHTFQNIGGFSCTESHFRGLFSSFQVGRILVGHFHGEFSAFPVDARV